LREIIVLKKKNGIVKRFLNISSSCFSFSFFFPFFSLLFKASACRCGALPVAADSPLVDMARIWDRRRSGNRLARATSPVNPRLADVRRKEKEKKEERKGGKERRREKEGGREREEGRRERKECENCLFFVALMWSFHFLVFFGVLFVSCFQHTNTHRQRAARC
jgi:hypothetical protein